MATQLFKNGECSWVPAHRVQAHLADGWTTENKPQKAEPDESDDDLEELKEAYKAKFGKKPHHKMLPDTMREALNGDPAEETA